MILNIPILRGGVIQVVCTNDCKSCKLAIKCFSMSCSHFWKHKVNCLWHKYKIFSGEVKHFSGAILHGGSIETSQTSIIFAKIVKGYKWLTICAKRLHRRYSTWLKIHVCEHNFTFKVVRKTKIYRKLMKFFKVLLKQK